MSLYILAFVTLVARLSFPLDTAILKYFQVMGAGVVTRAAAVMEEAEEVRNHHLLVMMLHEEI